MHSLSTGRVRSKRISSQILQLRKYALNFLLIQYRVLKVGELVRPNDQYVHIYKIRVKTYRWPAWALSQ